MIRWYNAALAPTLLWYCAPARAADIVTIDCVAKLLDPATTNSVSDDFQARIESAQNGLPDLPPQKGSASDPAVRAEVTNAAARCGDAYGWTLAARIAAGEYTFEKLALPLFEAPVRNDGIDPGQIARLSKGLRALPGWEEGPLPESEKRRRIVYALSFRLLRAGISLQTPQQMRDVHALTIWLVELDKTQTDFIAA